MRCDRVAPPSLLLSTSTGSRLRAAAYVFHSTAGVRSGRRQPTRPSTRNQLRALDSFITQRGWSRVRTYRDLLTGEKQARPSLERLISDAEQGQFQVAMFFSFICFADNLRQLVLGLHRLHHAAVAIVCIREQLDSTTAEGRRDLELVCQLRDFEGSLAGNRITVGIEKAKRFGTKSGLPAGRPCVEVDPAKVRELRDKGMSQRDIAGYLGVGLGTVHRAL